MKDLGDGTTTATVIGCTIHNSSPTCGTFCSGAAFRLVRQGTCGYRPHPVWQSAVEPPSSVFSLKPEFLQENRKTNPSGDLRLANQDLPEDGQG
jgi:hypothetical protein